jgi:2-oxoisovalerate dehydrogenase E2 component (dihydrolipoyl transacylase)
MVEVMTDKAAVEVPAPVSGRVVSINGAPGDKIAVGLAAGRIRTRRANAATQDEAAERGAVQPGADCKRAPPNRAPSHRPRRGQRHCRRHWNRARSTSGQRQQHQQLAATGRVMASPADRRRAREAGIDLATVAGSGPGGRIVRGDLDLAIRLGQGRSRAPGESGYHLTPARSRTTEIKVIGLRRLIAERMSEAKRTIPHFAYVEEVDVTELESLRVHLNAQPRKGCRSMSFLPLVVACADPRSGVIPAMQCACTTPHAGCLVRHRAVHVGIATQTPDGLKVPVVRNAQALGVWEIRREIRRLAERARSNKATREELTGPRSRLPAWASWEASLRPPSSTRRRSRSSASTRPWNARWCIRVQSPCGES